MIFRIINRHDNAIPDLDVIISSMRRSVSSPDETLRQMLDITSQTK